MLDLVYQKFDLPTSSYLGKKVFKKYFFENAYLTSSDKKYLREDVDTILWQYTLKPKTVQIKSYVDEQYEYLEVALLEVTVRSPDNYKRLASVFHKSIPYPCLIIFTCVPAMTTDNLEQNEDIEDGDENLESQVALSVAHKRFSHSEKGSFVVENIFNTNWINLNSPAKIENAFIESLKFSDLPHTHFLAFYSAIIDRFVAFDCAKFSGTYEIGNKNLSQEERRQKLETCHNLKRKIDKLRNDLRNETQFNRKVELNTEIKQSQQQLEQESESI
jgi:hypothetical protein